MKEWLARILVIGGLLTAIGIPVVGWWENSRGYVLHGRMAETGGWTPENLTAEVGKPLSIKLTSDDVTHGFAVGRLGEPAVDVIPGEVTEVSLLFEKPGKYTFYCTRWCSVNHWRMRGTIEVSGPDETGDPAGAPLYQTLGLDIDAEHRTSKLPGQTPSAWRGAMLNVDIPKVYKEREYYLSHAPDDLWMALRLEESLNDLSEQEVWDLVAWIWQLNTTPEEIRLGKELYRSNCAACHGENGDGNGVFAKEPGLQTTAGHTGLMTGSQILSPADFTDASRMFGASSALLQGKIIRGGMGTGMPYWGPIFTEDQTWALIAYLWTFQFK